VVSAFLYKRGIRALYVADSRSVWNLTFATATIAKWEAQGEQL
jgi:hypothetical protein